jgi:hypothetical protein
MFDVQATISARAPGFELPSPRPSSASRPCRPERLLQRLHFGPGHRHHTVLEPHADDHVSDVVVDHAEEIDGCDSEADDSCVADLYLKSGMRMHFMSLLGSSGVAVKDTIFVSSSTGPLAR